MLLSLLSEKPYGFVVRFAFDLTETVIIAVPVLGIAQAIPS